MAHLKRSANELVFSGLDCPNIGVFVGLASRKDEERTVKPVAIDRPGRKLNVLLWVLQALLAMLFMFSGVMKFIMPVAEMTKQIALPGWFLHFIGASEILGAIGLVLPGILRIRTGLTPLAAAGLAIIMIGATTVNLKVGQGGFALTTVILGLLLVFVAYNRRRMLPRPLASPVSDPPNT